MPTALIVEDEPEANKLLGLLIKLRGYRSASALDGREALEQLGRFSPDVLFLDLMLPDMNGYDICRAIKGARATCLIPVVVVSARIAHRNRLDSFLAGADDFIAKPYTPEQIFDALVRADSLRAQAGLDRIEGTIRFDDTEGEIVARDLARLRGLVLGRCPLPEEEAAALVTVISRAATGIEDWSRAHPCGSPTTLDHELTREGLTLVFHGVDWLEPFEQAPDDPLIAGLGRFDEASIDRPGDRLTLVKRWA